MQSDRRQGGAILPHSDSGLDFDEKNSVQLEEECSFQDLQLTALVMEAIASTVPYQLLAAIELCFHANGRWVFLSPTEIVASAKSEVQRSTSQHPKCKSNP